MVMSTFLQPAPIKRWEARNKSFPSCPPRRSRPILPVTLQRSCGSKVVPLSCQKSAGEKKQEFFPETSISEQLFASYTHPTPRGTAQIALERGIPLRNVSEAYGHILAVTVLEDLPGSLNHEVFVNTMRDSLQADNRSSGTVDTARLSSLVTRAADPTQTLSHDDIVVLSKLYGQMLAVSVRLSALEFDTAALIDGTRSRLTDASTPFPMSREAYNEAFEDLQHCAATVQGTAAADAADSFFKVLVSDPHVEDLQADGYILAVHHSSSPSGSKVSLTDAVSLAARARLLDGRYILSALPSRDTPPNLDNALKVSLKNVPQAFAAALTGLSVGDSRTVFYHPYAAHEILPLFLAPYQIPPQAGLIIDLYLLHIH